MNFNKKKTYSIRLHTTILTIFFNINLMPSDAKNDQVILVVSKKLLTAIKKTKYIKNNEYNQEKNNPEDLDFNNLNENLSKEQFEKKFNPTKSPKFFFKNPNEKNKINTDEVIDIITEMLALRASSKIFQTQKNNKFFEIETTIKKTSLTEDITKSLATNIVAEEINKKLINLIKTKKELISMAINKLTIIQVEGHFLNEKGLAHVIVHMLVHGNDEITETLKEL